MEWSGRGWVEWSGAGWSRVGRQLACDGGKHPDRVQWSRRIRWKEPGITEWKKGMSAPPERLWSSYEVLEKIFTQASPDMNWMDYRSDRGRGLRAASPSSWCYTCLCRQCGESSTSISLHWTQACVLHSGALVLCRVGLFCHVTRPT